MATEIDDLLKSLKKNQAIEAQYRVVESNEDTNETLQNAVTVQTNILHDIVEYNKSEISKSDQLVMSMSRMVALMEKNVELSEIPPIPNGAEDEQTGLLRGILVQATAIRGVMDWMQDQQEKNADKKTWTNPAEGVKDEASVKLKDRTDEKGIMSTLADIGKWALTPVVAVAKFLGRWWKKLKIKMLKKVRDVKAKITGWIDDVVLKAKTFIDDGVKAVMKKFPKITNFFKMIGGFFKKIFSTGVGKWVAKGFKLFAKLGGQIAKGIFKFGGKILSKIAAPIIAIYDFFDGWFNADKITGIAKDSLSIWDKMSAGIASILSGLTAGFVTAQDWYDVIFGDYGIVDIVKGFFIDIWNMLPEGIQETAKGIWDGLTLLAEQAQAIFKDFFGMTITEKIEKIFDDFAAWIDENVSWDKLKPSWLPSFGGDDVEEKNADWEKKQRNKDPVMVEQAKAIAKTLDTSSKVLSDKKAMKAAQANQVPLVLQAPAPNVIVPGSEFTPSAFEGDMFMQLTGM
jgi:hypothetical protein